MISRYAVDSLDSIALTDGGVLGAAGDSLTEIPGRSEEQRQALAASLDQHLAVIEVAFQSIANHTNGIASCYYRINPEITIGEKGFFFSKKGNYDFQKIPMTDLAAYDRSDMEHVGWYYIPLEQGRPSWLEPYYSEVLDELVISYVVPIYKSGTFVGVIGMDIQFDTLVALIQQSTSFDTGYFSLTDNQGRVFYHPEYEMGTELESVLPQLFSTVQEMHQDSSQQQLIRYDKAGTKWQTAFTTLTNGMKLAAVVQEAEINASSYRLTTVFLVAGGLILLVFTLLCAITMRHVTDPLKRLTIAARQLTAGDYDVEVTCHSKDEVGVLSDTFCTMRDRLKAQFLQLSESKKNLQEALMDAQQASRAKTSFLSNMSHEIRTPMNAIIGLDNIALRDPGLSPNTREQLEKIGASAKHLLGLINDILDVSRIESGRVTLKEEEFSFRDLIHQINVMVNGQCMDKGLNFECGIIGRTEDYYIGDDLKLKQVLINILGNAVKFTPAPGTVTFQVEQTASFQNHRSLRFTIRDTGIGMSKEYIPKLFEAFSQETEGATNQYGSTGLGMAITKNIVTMMNGDIQVESEKGVGTTFIVTVTLSASGRSVLDESDITLPAGLCALLVDDEEIACQHACLVSESAGLQTEMALSGEEALTLFQARTEAHNPFQLALIDWQMPEMDGIALTRRIRAIDGGKTMVILLTGYSYENIRETAAAAGVDEILSKPLFSDTLSRTIHEILSRREEAPEPSADAEAEEPVAGLSGRRVLVVEDMELNAEILMDLLDMEEVSAEHAENGQIAVDLFSEKPAGYYDAILMDVRMPVLNGLDATRAIRSLNRPDAKQIPIIAMTANAFDEDVQRSLQAGMNAHLSKPVEPEHLFETLETLIRERESREQKEHRGR